MRFYIGTRLTDLAGSHCDGVSWDARHPSFQIMNVDVSHGSAAVQEQSIPPAICINPILYLMYDCLVIQWMFV